MTTQTILRVLLLTLSATLVLENSVLAQRIPTLPAPDDVDTMFMQDWVWAQDRFFQMDTLRQMFRETNLWVGGDIRVPLTATPGLETTAGGVTLLMDKTPIAISRNVHCGWLAGGSAFGNGFVDNKQLNQPGGQDFEGSGAFGFGGQLSGLLRVGVANRINTVFTAGYTVQRTMTDTQVVNFDPNKAQIIIPGAPNDEGTFQGGTFGGGVELLLPNGGIIRTLVRVENGTSNFHTGVDRTETRLGITVETNAQTMGSFYLDSFESFRSLSP